MFLPVVWSAALLLRKTLWYIGMTQYVEGLAHALALAVPMFLTFLIYKFRTFRID